MKFKDYYKVMGLERTASQDEIKRAYRRLAKKYHPDVSKESDAEAHFKEVGEAYEVLKDPEKRAAFDSLLAGGYRAGQDFRPPPDWDAGFEFRGAGFGAGDGRFSDFFESLFGGMGGGFADFMHRDASTAPGGDQHATILIDLEEAYHGTEKVVQLQVPEYDTRGMMRQRLRSLKVRIPRGISPGQRIRLAGQGDATRPGGRRGDLYLKIDIRPHRLYQVDGNDIRLELPVAPWEAALGAQVPVPTLGGHVDMKIPAGVQSGSRLRLKGRGLGGSQAGDQYVIIQIRTPPADTAERKALYQRMAREMAWDPRGGL